MSIHSYSRVWVHLVWGTLERRPVITKPAAVRVAGYLDAYAQDKGMYLKTRYVNPDHVHMLLDLPTGLSIEEMVKLLKGSSSHWINQNGLIPGRFAWGRGYGIFSVSQSALDDVCQYIAGQEEHHGKKSFTEELQQFVERYHLQWRSEETVETVPSPVPAPNTPLKWGVNERASQGYQETQAVPRHRNQEATPTVNRKPGAGMAVPPAGTMTPANSTPGRLPA